MAIATAQLSYFRMSPRKARLVADLVRGMRAGEALAQLKFSKKRSSIEIEKLLKSAMANAKQNAQVANPENLYISNIGVDDGPTLKRIRPRARGSAYLIRKRTSHVKLSLDEKAKNNYE